MFRSPQFSCKGLALLLPHPPGLSEGDRPRVYLLKVGLELSSFLAWCLHSDPKQASCTMKILSASE